MLELNPYFRESPSNILQSTLFDEWRSAEMEAEPPKIVSLRFDGKMCFDYNTLSPIGHSVESLKSLIEFEVASFF